MIFQLIPVIEYLYQWPSLCNVWGTLHLGILLWKKELLFCLKCVLKLITKDRQYLSQDFIQIVWLRLFIICLTSDQWSLICFLTSLKNYSDFCLEDEARNSQVFIYLSSTLCFLLRLLGAAFTFIVVMGLKHWRKFLCNCIYAGVSGGF